MDLACLATLVDHPGILVYVCSEVAFPKSPLRIQGHYAYPIVGTISFFVVDVGVNLLVSPRSFTMVPGNIQPIFRNRFVSNPLGPFYQRYACHNPRKAETRWLRHWRLMSSKDTILLQKLMQFLTICKNKVQMQWQEACSITLGLNKQARQ